MKMETLQKSRININEERAGNMSRSTGGGGNGKIRNISHGRSRDDGRKTGTSRDAKKGGGIWKKIHADAQMRTDEAG